MKTKYKTMGTMLSFAAFGVMIIGAVFTLNFVWVEEYSTGGLIIPSAVLSVALALVITARLLRVRQRPGNQS